MNPNTPAEIFSAVVQLSWRASWLIAIVLVLRVLLRGRLPAGVWFWTWIVIALRLLLPFSISTSASPYNWSRRVAAAPAVASPARAPALPAPAPRSTSAMPSLALDVAPPSASAPFSASSVPSRTHEAAPPAHRPSWGSILAGVWLAVALAIVSVRIAATARFARRLRLGRILDDARLQAIVVDESQRLGLTAGPSCIETDEVQAPALFGLWRPSLLFPRGLVATLSDEELRLVVLHELGHHCRRDLLSHSLLQAAAAVHWFNPLVWVATWLARTDCELACDAFVLRNGRTTLESYGAALLRVLGATRAAYGRGSIVVSIVEGKQQLVRRVRMISEFRRPAVWQSIMAATVVAALAAVGATRESRAESGSAKPANSPTSVAKNGEDAPALAQVASPAAVADAPKSAANALSPRPAAPSDSNAQLKAEQHQLDALTAALDSYRMEHNLIAVDDRRDLYRSRLKAAASRRDDLQREVSLLDSRLKLLGEYRRRGADLTTLPFIGDDSLVRQLAEQVARQKIEIAPLQQRYGEKHPEFIRATQLLQDLSVGLERAVDAAAQKVQGQRDTTAEDLRVVVGEFSHLTDDALNFESEVTEYEKRRRDVQLREAATRQLAPEAKTAQPAEAAFMPAVGEFSVSVVGAVNRQAGVGFSPQDKPMVLDAIARAGGFSPTANRGGVRILRLQSDGSRRPIELSEADVMGGTGEAAHVQRGDVIIVSDSPARQYVMLLGSVNIAGRVELPGADQPKMTLIELLARAGGATRVADLRHVRVTRKAAGNAGVDVQTINLADVLSGKTPTPSDLKAIELEPGDVVTVPERVM